MDVWKKLQRQHLPECTYCTDPATVRDHVPPRKLAPFNTKTVPACFRCNSILRDVPILDLHERMQYVTERIEAKTPPPRKIPRRAT